MINAPHKKYYAKLLTDDNYDLWDELVDSAERGTLFHQTHWLKSFDKSLAILGCYDQENKLVGGMPLSYQRNAGLSIARPPYLTPYLGPIVFKREGKYHHVLTVEKEIALSLIEYAKSFFDFVRIPLSPNVIDTQPYRQNGFNIDVEYTYVAKLDDMDQVWKELDQDRRRKIRKGSEEGLLCNTNDNLDEFFPLLMQSLEAHDRKISPHRINNMQNWYRSLRAKNLARFLQIVDSSGRICAGAILAWDSKRAYYLLSGMDREISSSNVMAFLIWQCMCFCKEEMGVQEFDFDGSEIPSVEIFFRGFGGRLVPRFSVTWGNTLTWPIRFFWKLLTGNT